VTTTAETPVAVRETTRAGRMLRWAAVVGQLLQAATSFLLTLVFAHALPSVEFGSLVLYSLVFVLLMTLFRTVLGEQVIARPSPSDVRAVGQLALLAGAAYLVVGGALALLLGQLALLAGVLTFAAFSASDGVRYAWMALATTRDRVLLLGIDLARAAAAAAALAVAPVSPAAAGLLAMLAGSAWLAVGLRRYGRPRVREVLAFLATRGAFEVAMLTQFLIGTGVGQLVPVLALWAFGAGVFGQLRLAQTLLAPASTLAFAFQPVLLRVYAGHSGADEDRRRTLQLLAVAAAACAVLLPIGIPVAGLLIVAVLGARGAAVLPFLLPAAAGVATAVLSLPGGALIRVRRLAGASMAGQLVAAGASILFGVAALTGGPVVFAWALTAGILAGVAASYLVLVRTVA
jgi:hypothetical protein